MKVLQQDHGGTRIKLQLPEIELCDYLVSPTYTWRSIKNINNWFIS